VLLPMVKPTRKEATQHAQQSSSRSSSKSSNKSGSSIQQTDSEQQHAIADALQFSTQQMQQL
jgi:hypothetical protein